MKRELRKTIDFLAPVALLGILASGISAPEARAGSGCDPPPQGLISWWEANSNGLDLLGGNNGTLVNNAGYAVGEVGTAFSFTNALAAVEVGNATNLHLQSFTIEAWIQRKSASSVTFDASGDAEIFGFGSGGYALGIHSDGTLFLTENDVDELDASVGVTGTGFHHVAVTKSGVNVVFYLDGVAYPAGSTGNTYSFTTPAAIGARGDTLANSFYGSINALSIYNRGLLASEIAGIFNAGASGKCAVPQIVVEPASQSVFVGAQAQFSVTAQSTKALSYQWMLDGTNLPPDTNSTLTLTNVQLTQAGSYTVAVSNLYGAVTSVVAVLTVSTGLPCVSPPAGLISWWPGEASALDVADGNNGTLTGAVRYAPGEVGHGFLFGGTGAAINLGYATNLQLQNFTVECWIQRSTNTVVSLDPLTGSGILFGYGVGGYDFYMLSSGQLALTWNGYNYASTTAAVTDTNLHHVAVTISNSSVVFYLNGVAYSYGTYDASFSFTTQASIGAEGGTQSQSFYGLIDELAVYSRALTAAEIQSIYNHGAGGKCLALSIAKQPASAVIYAGKSTAFSALAVGRPPLSYQWSLGPTNIPGATNCALILTNVQVSQAGSYSVTVSNPDGSVTSSNALLTVNSPPACVSAPANLVAWWQGEENALDELGGINGTVTGSVSYAPGEAGQGFLFGGIDAAVNLGYATNLQLQNFTIECWIQRSTNTLVSVDPLTGNGVLFGYGVGGYDFYMLPSGHLALTWNGNSSASSTAAVTDTNLHHVAVTRSNSSVVFYLDGVAYNYGTYNATFSFTTQASIGAVGGTQSQSFYGLIDELAVYNRALTAAEIQSIYNVGAGGKCAIAYPPVLVSVPASRSVLLHGTTSLLVSAAGTVPLTYQWNLDGTNLPAATNQVLTLANIQINQGGSYSVTVSNSVTNVTSSNAVVTVTYPTAAVKVVGTNATAGSMVAVPVTLAANGNENLLELQFKFRASRLDLCRSHFGRWGNRGFPLGRY